LGIWINRFHLETGSGHEITPGYVICDGEFLNSGSNELVCGAVVRPILNRNSLLVDSLLYWQPIKVAVQVMGPRDLLESLLATLELL